MGPHDPPLLFGDRAKALEPTLNAISTETFESALSKAETPALGLFFGVPTFDLPPENRSKCNVRTRNGGLAGSEDD